MKGSVRALLDGVGVSAAGDVDSAVACPLYLTHPGFCSVGGLPIDCSYKYRSTSGPVCVQYVYDSALLGPRDVFRHRSCSRGGKGHLCLIAERRVFCLCVYGATSSAKHIYVAGGVEGGGVYPRLAIVWGA